jgi:hypothetical protein
LFTCFVAPTIHSTSASQTTQSCASHSITTASILNVIRLRGARSNSYIYRNSTKCGMRSVGRNSSRAGPARKSERWRRAIGEQFMPSRDARESVYDCGRFALRPSSFDFAPLRLAALAQDRSAQDDTRGGAPLRMTPKIPYRQAPGGVQSFETRAARAPQDDIAARAPQDDTNSSNTLLEWWRRPGLPRMPHRAVQRADQV